MSSRADLIFSLGAEPGNVRALLDQVEKGEKDVGTAGERAGRRARKGADEARRGWKSFDEMMGGRIRRTLLGVGAALGGIIGTRAIIAGIRSSIEAMEQQEDAVNRVRAALGRQGSEQLKLLPVLQEQAAALQKVTRFGDEAILSAQALGLSSGISADKIQQVTKVALDMTAALKASGDQSASLETTMRLLAQASAGNVEMLGRYLPEVRELAKAGASADEIMSVLQERFAGAAQADVETMSGRMQQLHNVVGDLSEEIGFGLVQGFGAAMGGAAGATGAVQSLTARIASATPQVKEWARTFSELVVGALKKAAEWSQEVLALVEKIAARGSFTALELGGGTFEQQLENAQQRVDILIDAVNALDEETGQVDFAALDALEEIGVHVPEAARSSVQALRELQASLEGQLEVETRMRNQVAQRVHEQRQAAAEGRDQAEQTKIDVQAIIDQALARQAAEKAASEARKAAAKEEAAAAKRAAQEEAKRVEELEKLFDRFSDARIAGIGRQVEALHGLGLATGDQVLLLERIASQGKDARTALIEAFERSLVSADELRDGLKRINDELDGVSGAQRQAQLDTLAEKLRAQRFEQLSAAGLVPEAEGQPSPDQLAQESLATQSEALGLGFGPQLPEEQAAGQVLDEEQVQLWRDVMAEVAEHRLEESDAREKLIDQQLRWNDVAERSLQIAVKEGQTFAKRRKWFQQATGVTQQFATALVDMAIAGELSGKKLLAASLRMLSDFARQKMLENIARAYEKAAEHDYRGAALAGLAAAGWGVLAAGAGIAAASVGSEAGRDSDRDSAQGGGGFSNTAASDALDESAAGGPSTHVVVHMSGAVGDTAQVGRELARTLEQELEEAGHRSQTRR